MNLFQKVEHFRKGKFLLHNSEDIMIEEIYLFELIIKIPVQSFCGRYQLNPLIIITISLFSLMDVEKSLTPIDHFQLWEPMIYLIRAEARSYRLSLN